MNKTTNQTLLPQVLEARTFWERGRGLLGRSGLPEGEALWIHQCNSIHTFFMKFSIDCVFVDRNLQIKAIREDVRPWRLILPVWGARSVFEMAAGSVKAMKVKVGDQLHVGA